MDMFLRARILTQTVTLVTFQCTVSAPWLDHTYQADRVMLSPELLSATSSIARLIDEAEGDVVSLLTKRLSDTQRTMWLMEHTPDIVAYINADDAQAQADAPSAMIFDAGVELPGFFEAMQSEIAAQAEHLFQREQLRRRDGDKEAQVTWRKMGRFAPGLGQRLMSFRPKSNAVWRGR
jgi:hypothetical protein